MGNANWYFMDVIGPVILLVLLAWLAFRSWGRRSPAENERTEQGTRDVYREEEIRRREGTDDL
ncbi:MAG: hypothetical protein H0X53_01675 [Sphingomonas sp.]|nr:hypothetical protein [Sphingomonas sp.]